METIEWFGNQMNKTIAEINDQFSKFRISDALHLIYKLIWDDFCAWYLEAIKPNYGEGISQEVYDKTIVYFEELNEIIASFHAILNGRIVSGNFRKKHRRSFGDCSTEKTESFSEENIKAFETAKELISGVRNYRQSKGISPREAVNYLPMLLLLKMKRW